MTLKPVRLSPKEVQIISAALMVQAQFHRDKAVTLKEDMNKRRHAALSTEILELRQRLITEVHTG